LAREVERLQIRTLLYGEIEQSLFIRRWRRIVVCAVERRIVDWMIETEHLIERGHGASALFLRIELQQLRLR
jgi:hypothetical protein